MLGDCVCQPRRCNAHFEALDQGGRDWWDTQCALPSSTNTPNYSAQSNVLITREKQRDHLARTIRTRRSVYQAVHQARPGYNRVESTGRAQKGSTPNRNQGTAASSTMLGFRFWCLCVKTSARS